MKFGIFVMPQQPRSDDPVRRFREVVDQVRLARDAGFDALAAGHHYLSPPFQSLQSLPLLARLSGEAPGKHRIQGIGAGFVPKVLNTALIDEVIKVAESDTMATAHALSKKEGIPGGISTGAIVWAAIQVAKRPENKGKLIVAIAPSCAERYLSSWLFADISALHYRPFQLYHSLMLVQEYGIWDKVLFGTDYPFTNVDATLAGLRGLNEMLAGTALPLLDEDAIERMIYRDTLPLLGLER